MRNLTLKRNAIIINTFHQSRGTKRWKTAYDKIRSVVEVPLPPPPSGLVLPSPRRRNDIKSSPGRTGLTGYHVVSGFYCIFILGDPGAASRDDGIFMGESLQQERESPWALTLTARVPEEFEIPPPDWPEKYFSGQSAKRNSRATLMSSYTRLFSSSNAVVAWPVQREHF